MPYSPENNLLTHRVIVLPSAVGDYESEADLLDEVQDVHPSLRRPEPWLRGDRRPLRAHDLGL